jgi:hypothetical protein
MKLRNLRCEAAKVLTRTVEPLMMMMMTGYFIDSGPYYPSDTIGTVPRTCDMFRAYEGIEGRKNKEMKSRKM